MFADISGSTELVQHLDPEEAANLLDPLIRGMTETVERYQGAVSPRGDGILAIFGIAGSAEDNPVRACLAALDIMARLSLRDDVPRLRIGIHHGEVALLPGSRGQRGHNAFGPAIHIAARLEQTAEPGTACLSAETHALVQDFIETRALPPVQVKGFTGQVERMQLLGVRSASRWHARLARGLTPFVGRRDELLVIRRWLADEQAGARLFQVQGQAGIGKSRLIHEALQDESARRCCRIAFSGPVHRGFTGHDPIATWLRELGRSSAAQAGRETDTNLIGALQRDVVLSADDAERLARYLGLRRSHSGSMTELTAEPPLAVAPLLAAVMAGVAHGRRIILSCEDAETLEPAVTTLLTSIVAELAGRGCTALLLMSSRTPLRLSADVFRERRSVRLRALPTDDARRLLGRLYPSLHDRSLADLIVTKAEGNPLYLEEVAALLLSRSVTTTEIVEHSIPDGIEPLIADRLARVPQTLQALLRICSVLGKEFSPDLLAGIVGLRPSILTQQIARLREEHLLDEHVDAANGTIRLGFRHALLRDVAYNTLLPSRRRAIHAQIVALLESTIATTPERLDELCHHAVQGRLWRPALLYLQQAAVAAAERTAYPAAERHLRKALEIAQSLPQDRDTRAAAVDFMIGLRMLLALDLRYDEADRLLDRAQRIAEDRQAGELSADIRLSILIKRVHVLNTLGRTREATAVAAQADRAAAGVGDVSLQLAAAHFLGQTCFYTGRFNDGDTVLSRSIALLTGFTDASNLRFGSLPVLIYATRAGIRGLLGNFAKAARDAVQAMSIATTDRRPYDITFAHLVAGMLRLQRRDGPEAEAAFRAGLELAERHGLKALLPSLNAGLGHSLLLAGSMNAAISSLSEAHETAKGRGRLLIHMWAAIGLAAAYGCTGGQVQALRHAEEAVQIGIRHTMRGYLVAALRCKGLLLAGDKESAPDQALRIIRHGLALARKLGTEPEIAASLAALHLVSPTGDAMAAAEARRRFAGLGMDGWAATVLAAGRDGIPLAVAAF